MEDTLGEPIGLIIPRTLKVLILIVMEDTLGDYHNDWFFDADGKS